MALLPPRAPFHQSEPHWPFFLEWLGNLFADLTHGVEVGPQSVLKVLACLFLSVARSHASRYIR